jgi:CRP/FNR family transcriptional regulator
MDNDLTIKNSLAFLEQDLLDEIIQCGELKNIAAQTVLIREGQYIKHLPIIIDGIVKVYSQFDDKDLLLYYIKPRQSCIISFSAAIYNEPSKIYAVTEESSQILLVPAGKVSGWMAKFPRFNKLFFDLYHHRYLELLDTINQLVFKTLDRRLMHYLEEKADMHQSSELDLRHHQIAKDLGTAREVISRVMKKLEGEGYVLQEGGKIKILKGPVTDVTRKMQ